MVDSYGGFFRCGKCDFKFNFYDQFESPVNDLTRKEFLLPVTTSAEHDDTEVSKLIEQQTEPQDEKIDVSSEQHVADSELFSDEEERLSSADLRPESDSESDKANIVFNQYGEHDDELREPKLKPTRDSGLFVRNDADEFLNADETTNVSGSAKSSDVTGDLRQVDDEDFLDASLRAELEKEDELQRKAIFGTDQTDGMVNYNEPQMGDDAQDIDRNGNTEQLEPALSILDDVDDEPKAIGNAGAFWIAIKHTASFLFWIIIALALLGLLVYQFKPTLSTSLQNKISNSAVVQYGCKFIECETGIDPSSLDIVVSRMDLNLTPSEPLNVSLFILNRLKVPQKYPVVKLSLKNLRGLTVGQRFLNPEDYLTKPEAVIPPGNIGKVILKLDNPPDNAVGFEVSLH